MTTKSSFYSTPEEVEAAWRAAVVADLMQGALARIRNADVPEVKAPPQTSAERVPDGERAERIKG